jgi:hypothetical protein
MRRRFLILGVALSTSVLPQYTPPAHAADRSQREIIVRFASDVPRLPNNDRESQIREASGLPQDLRAILGSSGVESIRRAFPRSRATFNHLKESKRDQHLAARRWNAGRNRTTAMLASSPFQNSTGSSVGSSGS